VDLCAAGRLHIGFGQEHPRYIQQRRREFHSSIGDRDDDGAPFTRCGYADGRVPGGIDSDVSV
jgi:hypothetical protein